MTLINKNGQFALTQTNGFQPTYLKKIKLGLWDRSAVCVCVLSHFIDF
jgi:hypothetical protein